VNSQLEYYGEAIFLKRTRRINVVLAVFLICLVLGGLFWVSIQFSENNPGGNDFLVHYIGTRSLIFDHLSPYSDEVALRIQMAAYGHPAQGVEHELRVAYPLYSIFLFAPFSLIGNYVIARAVWMTVLELALIAMTFLTLDLLDWKPTIWVQAAILLFSMIWYHAVRGLINGNAVILVALMLTAVFSFIKRGRDELAGFILAITTIKPHLVVLIILFITVWSIYHKRWGLLKWLLISMAGLIGLGLILIPDWIYQNLWEVLKYPAYNPAGTLAAALAEWFPAFGPQFKWSIAVIGGLVLVVESWRARKGDFSHFLWTGFLVLAISQWIGIQTDPGNFILLFPALMLVLSILNKRWQKQGKIVSSAYLAFLLIMPWILFVSTIQRSYQPVQSPAMFLPVPLVSLLGLYWVKWWVISPSQQIWIERP
jgi:hypothetical protein